MSSDSDIAFDESGSDFEEPKAKKKASPKKAPAKKATAPKSTAKKGAAASKQNGVNGAASTSNGSAQADKENEDMAVFTNIDKLDKKGMAIEKIYQKKTQLEHILLRPDTYIGSVEYCDKTMMWVFDEEQDKLVEREISFVPGLYKIFDEILVNAADNKQRDSSMNLIKINIDKEKNEISVYNNGKGIPVVEHKVEKMYVPEMIFGTLLTSSNYNDDERKVTGGRNGYGAKLCNVFSKKFTIETSSREYKQQFKQTWINNMTKDKDAVISKATGDDYTKVTFQPDLSKFKMTKLDDDIVALMSRRAYDIAGTSDGVKVFLNNRQIPCKGFKEYVEQYTKDYVDSEGERYKVCYEKVNNRWEVAATVSVDRGFQQVSFVNSIATTKGGRHVDYVADQVVGKVVDTIKKKAGKSGVNIQKTQIRQQMWVFVKCLIENPTFDSQTKETMTLQPKNFGSTCDLGEKFSKEILKCGIVEQVMSWVRYKQEEQLNKKCVSRKTSKLKGMPKLEDANDAGTKNSHQCTLILTEGDSAKSLAVAGLGVIGRDKFGVFPLRGKMLNVREGSHEQIMKNAEITALLKIVGLQYRQKYESDEDMKTLRYGKIMIMADQDQDGSHIKGLLINFIHTNWPNLIKKNFVEEFITPIVKATKGKEEISFYSIPEYVEWRQNTDNWKSYRIKYYKGLGTSTSKEAKEYFSDMLRHRIKFKYGGDTDDQAVELAFSKKKIEERKGWLTSWMEIRKQRREQGQMEDYLYGKDTRAVTYSDFINKELVLFSNADNERSIPSLVDGLKPGQRKVLFTCFKRADKKEVKVAQLAGAVGEMSAYHHGEQSLMMTIVGLAQDYVGSNNINLLLPIGQFGTRLQGGKDSASPRYIFTQLNPVTKALFPKFDEHVLRFLYEENQRIEPEWYCPIIPTVLVNGAEGIGTGWSTKVPNFDPREIVANIRRLIRGEEMKPMLPWYRHFNGSIVQLDDTRFVCSGEVGVVNQDTIEITELPVKMWTQNYKETVIEPMLEGVGDKQALIQDFKEYHTDQTVKFIIKMTPEKLQQAQAAGFHKVFKLQNSINTSCMVLFDAAGCLRKFDTPESICKEFFETRKNVYIERKRFMEGMLEAQSGRLSEQARFILMKIKGEVHIENKRKTAIIEQLIQHKFKPDPVRKWNELQKKRELEMCGEAMVEEEDDQEQEEGGPVDKKVADYDYLVGMAMWKLSMEDKDKLLRESEEKKKELATLQQKSWSDLWEEDLTEFLIALEKQEKKEKADIEETIKTAAKKLTKDGNAAMRGGAKKFAEEVKPNPKAIRIEPTLDHMKEKYTEKPKREPKVKKEKKVKKEGQDIRSFLENGEENGVEENGEDDWPGQNEDDDETSTKEVKPKKASGKEPKSKTETKAKAPRAKKATGQSGPSKKSKKKIDVSDEEIDDIVISDDDDDDQPGPSVQRSPPARRARPTVKYSVSDGESDDDDVIPVKKSRKIISDDEDFAAEED